MDSKEKEHRWTLTVRGSHKGTTPNRSVFTISALYIVLFLSVFILFFTIVLHGIISSHSIAHLLNPFNLFLLLGTLFLFGWVVWLWSLRIEIRDDCLIVHMLFKKIELNYKYVRIVRNYNFFAKRGDKYGGNRLLYGDDEICALDFFLYETALIETITEKKREYILANPDTNFHANFNRRAKKTKSLFTNIISSLFATLILFALSPIILKDIKSVEFTFNGLLPIGAVIFVVIFVLMTHLKEKKNQEKNKDAIGSALKENYQGDLSKYDDIHIVEAYDYLYDNPDERQGTHIFSELKRRGLAHENDFTDNDILFVMKDGYSCWDNIKSERIKLAKKFIYVAAQISDLSPYFNRNSFIIRTSDIISAKMTKQFDVAKLRYEEALRIQFKTQKGKNYILISAKNLESWVHELEKSGVHVTLPTK